jgi:hypothetical protein
MTYTIAVTASQTPGKVTARSSDGHTFATSAPLLTGSAHWLKKDADPNSSIVTVWSSGPAGHWALRSTIGTAAALTVGVNHGGMPIFVPFKGQ